MHSKPLPRLVAAPLAFAGALGAILLMSACADDEVGRMLRADAAAITADKARIDLDVQNGNSTAYSRDRRQLYLDVEKQEHDRGTEDDEFAEGEW